MHIMQYLKEIFHVLQVKLHHKGVPIREKMIPLDSEKIYQ